MTRTRKAINFAIATAIVAAIAAGVRKLLTRDSGPFPTEA